MEVVRANAKDYRGIGKAVGLESSPIQKFKDALGGMQFSKQTSVPPQPMTGNTSMQA